MLSESTCTGVDVKITMLATLDRPSAMAKGQPNAQSRRNKKRRVKLMKVVLFLHANFSHSNNVAVQFQRLNEIKGV